MTWTDKPQKHVCMPLNHVQMFRLADGEKQNNSDEWRLLHKQLLQVGKYETTPSLGKTVQQAPSNTAWWDARHLVQLCVP